MPDIDLGPITDHQARITAYALGSAIDTGVFTLRQNYQAAVEVKAMLSLRLAQAHCPQRDLSVVPDDDEGDHVLYADSVFDAVNGRWVDA